VTHFDTVRYDVWTRFPRGRSCVLCMAAPLRNANPPTRYVGRKRSGVQELANITDDVCSSVQLRASLHAGTREDRNMDIYWCSSGLGVLDKPATRRVVAYSGARWNEPHFPALGPVQPTPLRADFGPRGYGRRYTQSKRAKQPGGFISTSTTVHCCSCQGRSTSLPRLVWQAIDDVTMTAPDRHLQVFNNGRVGGSRRSQCTMEWRPQHRLPAWLLEFIVASQRLAVPSSIRPSVISFPKICLGRFNHVLA